jgi:hypothetical protein
MPTMWGFKSLKNRKSSAKRFAGLERGFYHEARPYLIAYLPKIVKAALSVFKAKFGGM